MNTKKLNETRDQIAALQEQLSDPVLAAQSRAERRADIAARVDIWHDEACGILLERIEAKQDLLVPTFNEYEDARQAVETTARESRAWLIFALGKAGMLARFDDLLTEVPEGIDAEARDARAADIRAQIEALEIKEEQAIRAIEANGGTWLPRPGQRPAVAIGGTDV